MTPAARLPAAIEILDEAIASARDDGPPADVIVTRYLKTRRYAGSGDRRAVRELVFRAIRRSAERPSSGRAAVVGLARDDADLLPLFGEVRGPAPIAEGEEGSLAAAVPGWLESQISPLIEPAEWPALLERAPLDLRRRPGGGAGRGQPVDRLGLGGPPRGTHPRPVRRRRRQGAGARGGRSGRADPRHRHQSFSVVEAAAASGQGRREDRDAIARHASRARGTRRLGR